VPARETPTPQASTVRGVLDVDPHPSKIRAGSVVRTALVNRLRAARAPLVLVRAPAGYGKTTLLAQWAARDARPFGWLELDDEDNDPAVLVRRIGLALRRLTPEVIPAAGERRPQGASTAIRRLSAAVRAAERPFVLVLDDAHSLRSRGSLAALATLVALVPDGSAIVLAGRSVRVAAARARAAGRLFELDTDDLALGRREEELLLREVGIALDPAGRSAVRKRMEGWAAGTYLAALALREAPAAVGSGEDRFVADYFDFECTSGLSTKELQFLLRTSVLERLSGSLCDHVLAADGSAARLESLARANLFVLPLDRDLGWYRCHNAFREYLLGELRRCEPSLVSGLHRRAATWYESNGELAPAAEHAHAGGDLDHVARLVVGGGLGTSTARSVTGEAWLGWFDRPELIRAHPDVAVLGTWAHLVQGRATEARRWRDGAVAAGGSGAAELALLRAARCEEGVERMRADAHAAVAGLAPASHWQPVALLLRGVAELLLGGVAAAEVTLADAGEAAESAAATEIEIWALSELAVAAWGAGDESLAHERALQACARIGERRLHDDPPAALAFAVAARLALRRGETTSALLARERADALVPRLTHALPWYAVQTSLELARVELALADPAAARRRLEAAIAVLRRRPRLGDLVGQVDELGEEIRALAGRRDGRQSGLTTAELRLLPLLTTHLSFREIAAELYVSRNTVKTQAISVYRKLNASSRSEAIARARELGLVDAASPRAEFTLSG
jgi:LuxR family maltose regulon positive regulatory protein